MHLKPLIRRKKKPIGTTKIKERIKTILRLNSLVLSK